MDNFSEASKKSDRFSNPAKRPKPAGRWTLLFIGNHGRTITLKRFKGMVLLTLLVLCISIAITVGLLFLSLNIRQDKAQLESQMNDLKSQIKTLRYEKDVLMTRLVLAESHSKENAGKIQEKQEASDPAAEAGNDSAKPEQPTAVTASPKAAPVPEQNESDEAAGQADTQLSVALEDFQLSPKPDENLLRFQFKIKNTSANSQRVSGHTVVVLKGDQISQAKWMAIPAMPLVDGKPTGRHKGHTFGINYFKTLRFSSNYPKYPDEYQVATVYVFSRRGELLLAEDFPVKLPPAFHEVPAESPASGETSPSAPPAASSDAPPPAAETINTQPNTTTP
jgi:hypothetical protein